MNEVSQMKCCERGGVSWELVLRTGSGGVKEWIGVQRQCGSKQSPNLHQKTTHEKKGTQTRIRLCQHEGWVILRD